MAAFGATVAKGIAPKRSVPSMWLYLGASAANAIAAKPTVPSTWWHLGASVAKATAAKPSMWLHIGTMVETIAA